MSPLKLVQTLGDEYSTEILDAADDPRSAQDLSAELDVPIATCYRRVDALTDAGLLENGGQVFSEGQRASAYRRAVDRIVVDFRGDRYTIEVEGRSDADRG